MDNKEYIIGIINFLSNDEEIFDEALGIKFKKKPGECYIKVKGNEGMIPHFHIESIDNKFYCCVCIYVPNYFTHKQGEGKLTEEQKDELDKFLRSINKDSGHSNWNYICTLWNLSNEQNRNTLNSYLLNNKLDPNNLTQPDYKLMKTSVH